MTFTLLAAAGIALQTNSGSDFFRIGQTDGRWHFVTPGGERFWSFGVCCVDKGTPWDQYDLGNPAYRAWSLFPNGEAWVNDTFSNLQSWGFNTIGGWGDYELMRKVKGEQMMPYFVVLHLGAYYRAPWDDLFSEEAWKAIDQAAQTQIEPIKDDPRLIGYFTDNELGWWDDTVFLSYVILLPPDSPGRKRAHQMLREHYGESFSAFLKDWETPATSWEEFATADTLTLRPGGDGMQAVNKWMGVIGDFYAKTVTEAIRRYDTKHLIAGERYLQYYNLEQAKAASPYYDLVSTNLGADWTNGAVTPFKLETLHRLSKKPIVITEFYMTATENRSGNKNSSANFPVVATQAERAVSYAHYVNSIGRLPYVVGAHWFQYFDEPTHGRADGEDYNMGLLDIFGEPYELMTRASAGFDLRSFLDSPRSPEFLSSIPRVEFDPMTAGGLKPWPTEVARVKSESVEAFGDLYAVRDATHLYLAVYAFNYIDEALYAGATIPEGERPRWRVQVGQARADIRFGGRKEKKEALPLSVTATEGIEVVEVPNLTYTVIVKVPLRLLGQGQTVLLTSTLDSHSRGESMTWAQELPLR